VVPNDQLMPTADRMAQNIAENGEEAIRIMRSGRACSRFSSTCEENGVEPQTPPLVGYAEQISMFRTTMYFN